MGPVRNWLSFSSNSLVLLSLQGQILVSVSKVLIPVEKVCEKLLDPLFQNSLGKLTSTVRTVVGEKNRFWVSN